jgi:hypothetical protein
MFAFVTQTTRDMLDGRKAVRRNMTNGKPYRTASQKAEARRTAVRCEDGAYRSSAPVSYNKPAQLQG